ncbi:MAG: prepilin-type N-terminal cleavage/methylation domain-containing protein [Armatimonadota bacterium]|nr:prepilin-type N-terminal cleavage/methylation domain-containing protein [Armatimonadota bacterium]
MVLAGQWKANCRWGLSPTRGGFTAIELMLVLTVLVIAASVVLPGFPGFVRGQGLKTSAIRLAGMARYAGEWSVLHERTVALRFDDEAHLFRLEVEEELADEALAHPLVEDEEPQSDERPPEIEERWSTLRLPEAVEVAVAEAADGRPLQAGEALLFRPDGRCDGGTFVLESGELRYTVRVGERYGRVTVELGDEGEEPSLLGR